MEVRKSEQVLAGDSDACFIPSIWEVEIGGSSIQGYFGPHSKF